MVDPLTFIGLLGFIAGATAFLNVLITMNIVPMKIVGRKKRALNLWDKVKDSFHEGNI